jgi:arylsulfatase A-like enzyme
MAAEGTLPDLLVLHLQEAHHPYLPPPQGFTPGKRLRYATGHAGYYLRCAQRAWEFAARADEVAWDDARRRYAACVRYVVGVAEGVLRAYQRAGVMEETLAIITADHGEHLGEHGLADHQGSLHEQLLHCPCALVAPPLGAGLTVRGQFQHTDLLRTICGWLSLPTGDCASAWPALDLLDEAHSGGHLYAFAEWRAWGEEQLRTLQRRNPTYDFAPLDRDLVAVRTERWKLIRGSDGSEMLFDLRSDQRESRNITAEEPAVVHELRGALEEWLAAVRPERGGEQCAGAPPAVEARLRELGYV